MTSEPNRRRFLQLTGTGTAAALAGCSDLNPLSDDGGEYDDVLTAVIGPDSAEIEELQEQVENEELDMMEAQQRQQELVEEAIDDFESRAEEDDDLTIEDASPEYGLYRIDGEAEAIVDELKGGPIASLSEGAAYDRILEEQEQQPEPADPEEDIDVEEEPEDDEAEGDEPEGDEADDGDEENGADDGDEPTDEDGDEADEDLETDD
ncbi:twin-arginine translocation signal domain-containing protein [Natronococcus sp.]|uniref:twin-arginine translocation signal domain-containing protein n=1 Tax=Natronococcus sp. TaxID=35747 RepID=UPI003A4D75EE